MSIRIEQYRALLKAREFLRDILDPHACPKTKRELRERAYSALRHYPMLFSNGRPMFSQDNIDLEDDDARHK